MENMVNPEYWRGRRVFLTGHTGFKGSWLALWLSELGAQVTGYALAPPAGPSLFTAARVGETLDSIIGDIRDAERLGRAIHESSPQTMLHLAAQPLVSEGYSDPVGTYTTNVIGTVNVLEAARRAPDLESIVVVTTDKCYDNRETLHDYRESDPMGGSDPYSSSKACAELVVAAYRRSFFDGPDAARLATARAGNVIGGGDWAANRLVPDLLCAFAEGRRAKLRFPDAIRPWQHALEPLAGYLMLAERLTEDVAFAGAWNFGPALSDCVTTAALADLVSRHWTEAASWESEATSFPHEAKLLRLNTDAARQMLKWRPKWPLNEAVRHTVAWHRAWLSGHDMQSFSRDQINQYVRTPNSPDEPR
ncbi:CDP-glucose 4,6-dehydratase [Dechloromonas denitrificans]|uniref:CDP-glucose 4,6-dehydratase n=1 Tax=Dechloromonas denitrificans TaxID=281362 RepID=UPI001CFB03BD|nr:CDP-glucose 4,6-dehydratase [Dechloromonas denitrificans]UCV08925.1 CDP-glucose 4,6-dehydratase [Dechloromonas denitrificans]